VTPEEQYQRLLNNNEVPALHRINGGKVFEISEFSRLSRKERESVRDSAIVVIDGHGWVASDSPIDDFDKIPEGINIYSGNGIKVGKHIRRTKFGVYQVGESGLIAEDYSHLYNKTKEEVENMEIQNADNMTLEALQASLMGSQAQAPQADVQPLDAFSDDSASKKKDTALRKEIAEAIENHKISRPFYVQIFNKTHGKMIGYVVNAAERIQFDIKSAPAIVDGKQQLNAKGQQDPAVRDKFMRGEKVSREYLQTEHRLAAKQTRPGKTLAVVLAIPLGGFVDMMDFRQPGDLRPNESQKDLKYMMLDSQVYPTFLDLYFGQGIKEDPATHGNAAGEVEQITSYRNKMVKGTPTTKSFLSRTLKTSSRKSLILPTNHIPIKTYETIRLDAVLTQEQVDLLNVSSFEKLFRSTNEAAPKYNLLAPEFRNLINRDENGRITSGYFTTDVANRVQLEVQPYWGDKTSEPLSVIEIPVKELRESKSGKAPYWRYITYDTTNEATINDPEKRAKTSLYSGKYDAFIKAANGAVTLESLRELTRRTPRGTKNTNVLSNEVVLKLQLGAAEKWFDPSLVEFSNQSDVGLDSIQEKIFAIRQKASQ
jgi:hypothetical protein